VQSLPQRERIPLKNKFKNVDDSGNMTLRAHYLKSVLI
jgi:hypothetical protein